MKAKKVFSVFALVEAEAHQTLLGDFITENQPTGSTS
jgi:hypothetical protein